MGTLMQQRWGTTADCLQLEKHMSCCEGTLMLNIPCTEVKLFWMVYDGQKHYEKLQSSPQTCNFLLKAQVRFG